MLSVALGNVEDFPSTNYCSSSSCPVKTNVAPQLSPPSAPPLAPPPCPTSYEQATELAPPFSLPSTSPYTPDTIPLIPTAHSNLYNGPARTLAPAPVTIYVNAPAPSFLVPSCMLSFPSCSQYGPEPIGVLYNGAVCYPSAQYDSTECDDCQDTDCTSCTTESYTAASQYTDTNHYSPVAYPNTIGMETSDSEQSDGSSDNINDPIPMEQQNGFSTALPPPPFPLPLPLPGKSELRTDSKSETKKDKSKPARATRASERAIQSPDVPPPPLSATKRNLEINKADTKLDSWNDKSKEATVPLYPRQAFKRQWEKVDDALEVASCPYRASLAASLKHEKRYWLKVGLVRNDAIISGTKADNQLYRQQPLKVYNL